MHQITTSKEITTSDEQIKTPKDFYDHILTATNFLMNNYIPHSKVSVKNASVKNKGACLLSDLERATSLLEKAREFQQTSDYQELKDPVLSNHLVAVFQFTKEIYQFTKEVPSSINSICNASTSSTEPDSGGIGNYLNSLRIRAPTLRQIIMEKMKYGSKPLIH